MKRIILSVEVPEYLKIDKDTSIMDFANHNIDFEILHPPTKKEIETWIDETAYGWRSDVRRGIERVIKHYFGI